jgi:hypothetical protein
MGNPKTYHFKLPPYQGPPLPEPPHSWYPGVQARHAASTSDRTLSTQVPLMPCLSRKPNPAMR